MPPDLLRIKELVELELAHSLDRVCPSPSLRAAKAYAMAGKAKRVRPLLVLTTAMALFKGSSRERAIRLAMPGALAVEHVHAYSLVHDDLPSMDDDDYRRGRLSVHRRFDEGLAILVGDALLADAFFLAASAKLGAKDICLELALTAGSSGLAAGQAEDLYRRGQRSADDHFAINDLKTARLFEASSAIGALSVDARPADRKAARAFGQSFGRAFQIKDDIEDGSGLCEVLSETDLIRMLSKNTSLALSIAEGFPSNEALAELIHFTFASFLSRSSSKKDRKI